MQPQQPRRSQLPQVGPYDPLAVHQIGKVQIGNDQVLRKFKQSITMGKNTLPGVFKYCILLSQYLKSPDIPLQQRLVHLFSTGFETQQLEVDRIWDREPPTLLPMTKVAGGLIKKGYNRKCMVTEKGFVQIDEKNKEKPFQVKKLEGLEEFPGKNKEMEWAKEGREYPWRVIMRDTTDALKAIYTKTEFQAIQLRDFAFLLSKKLKSASINSLARNFLDTKYKSIVANEFMVCMDSYNKRKSVIDQSRRQSQAGQMGDPYNQQQFPPYMPLQSLVYSQMLPITSQNLPAESLPQNSQIYQQNSQSQIYVPNSPAQNMPPSPNLSTSQFSPTPKPPVNTQAIDAKRRAIALALGGYDFYVLNGFVSGWMRKSTTRKSKKLQVMPEPEVLPMQKLSITFKTVQFLQRTDLFLKPLIFLQLVKGERVLFQSRYDTLLQKKSPCLSYKLMSQSPTPSVELLQNINTVSLRFKIIDRISGAELINDMVRLKMRERNSSNLYVLSDGGQVRIEMGIFRRGGKGEEVVGSEGLMLNIEPLTRASEEAIKRFWNQEAIKKDYYSPDLELDVFEILNKIEPVPKYWWMGLTEDEYQVLSYLQAASKILSFTVIEAHLFVIRALLKIYQSDQRCVQVTAKTALCLITQYLSAYFSKSGLSRLHPLHLFLGLDTDCSFPSRLTFQLSILNRMLQQQYPRLMHKLSKKNLHISLLLFEYLFEAFSRNFDIRTLVAIWNEVFSNKELVQQKLITVCVVLVGICEKELVKVNVEAEIRGIFENTRRRQGELVLDNMEALAKKYFTKTQGFLNTIVQKLFSEAYFQQTVNKFYVNQTQRLKQNADKKIPEKTEIMNKLIDKVPFKVPTYPPRKYTFHLYFSKFPNLEGIVFIKAGADEFQCFNKDTRQYFIIENVTQPVEISYVYRGKKWAAIVQMVQGVHFATLRLVSSGDFMVEQDIVIEYACGLLTEAQENMIKRNKPNQHFISPYMKLQNLIVECYKPPSQCEFLRENSLLPFDLLQGIRVLFTAGGNKFSDVDFYLSWIQSLKLPIFDKIQHIRSLSTALCLQQYHYPLQQAFKLLFRQLLARMCFPITDEQYEFYYNAQAPQFNSPRIIKCRFIGADGKVVKLTEEAQKYVSMKGAREIMSDIVLTSKGFLGIIAGKVVTDVREGTGTLVITYSTEGRIERKEVPLIIHKDTKELQINPKTNYLKVNGVKIKPIEPEILSVESFPAFSRITKMFESDIPTTRSLQSSRPPPKQHSNLLALLQSKFCPVIALRYKSSQPLIPKIPLMSYFSELTTPLSYPPLPRLLFQGQQWNPKRICTYRGELEISDNRQGENFPVDKRIGIHANIARWEFKTPTVYFWKVAEKGVEKREWRVYVYYGVGVERWEKVQVKGYCVGMTGQKYYIVILNGQEKLAFPEDLDLGGEDPFREVDISRDDHILRQLKRIEGKSEAQKTQQMADRRKFKNFLQLQQ